MRGSDILRKALFWVIIFLIGVVIGKFWYPGVVIQKIFEPITQNNCLAHYPLTSGSLDCATYDEGQQRLKNVDDAIDTATAQYVQEGKATRISVWIRDLTSGQTASNNENQRYEPASLLKLPLMIAYFKVAEIEPSILNTMLPYATSSAIDNGQQDIPSPSNFVVGQSYTVEQHIENMMINSDNNSASVLQSHIDQTIFTNTLLDLGIKILSSDNTGYRDLVTAKTYATIMRTLYNASYLNRDYSEKSLEIMTKSAFKGISEPLPANTKVAHKFGEREVDAADGSALTREFHDCGIVYKNNNPYSLCIMTQGKSFDDLQTVIKNISQLVYRDME